MPKARAPRGATASSRNTSKRNQDGPELQDSPLASRPGRALPGELAPPRAGGSDDGNALAKDVSDPVERLLVSLTAALDQRVRVISAQADTLDSMLVELKIELDGIGKGLRTDEKHGELKEQPGAAAPQEQNLVATSLRCFSKFVAPIMFLMNHLAAEVVSEPLSMRGHGWIADFSTLAPTAARHKAEAACLEARAVLARLQRTRDSAAGALQHLNGLVARLKKGGSSDEWWVDCWQAGVALASAGDVQRALDFFRGGLAALVEARPLEGADGAVAAPGSSPTMFGPAHAAGLLIRNMGLQELRLGRPGAALEHLDQACQMPSMALESKSHFWRSVALLRLGRYSEAAEAVEAAARLGKVKASGPRRRGGVVGGSQLHPDLLRLNARVSDRWAFARHEAQCHRLLGEWAHGRYDLDALLDDPPGAVGLDHANYNLSAVRVGRGPRATGPVTATRRPGLHVTKDFRKGELIMVCQAQFYGSCESGWDRVLRPPVVPSALYSLLRDRLAVPGRAKEQRRGELTRRYSRAAALPRVAPLSGEYQALKELTTMTLQVVNRNPAAADKPLGADDLLLELTRAPSAKNPLASAGNDKGECEGTDDVKRSWLCGRQLRIGTELLGEDAPLLRTSPRYPELETLRGQLYARNRRNALAAAELTADPLNLGLDPFGDELVEAARRDVNLRKLFTQFWLAADDGQMWDEGDRLESVAERLEAVVDGTRAELSARRAHPLSMHDTALMAHTVNSHLGAYLAGATNAASGFALFPGPLDAGSLTLSSAVTRSSAAALSGGQPPNLFESNAAELTLRAETAAAQEDPVSLSREEELCIRAQAFEMRSRSGEFDNAAEVVLTKQGCGFEPMARRTGLWLLPSLANHACIATASRVNFGRLCFVHAQCDLKAGDELTLSLTEDALRNPAALRERWCVTCTCDFCRLGGANEPADPEVARWKRVYHEQVLPKLSKPGAGADKVAKHAEYAVKLLAKLFTLVEQWVLRDTLVAPLLSDALVRSHFVEPYYELVNVLEARPEPPLRAKALELRARRFKLDNDAQAGLGAICTLLYENLSDLLPAEISTGIEQFVGHELSTFERQLGALFPGSRSDRDALRSLMIMLCGEAREDEDEKKLLRFTNMASRWKLRKEMDERHPAH
jgi:tetratricopeptide (TPR) repeat protein